MSTETIPAPGAEPEVKVPVVSELPSPDQAKTPVESAEGQSEPQSQEDEAAKKPKQTVSERIGQIHAAKKQAEAERSIALKEVDRLRGELEKLHAQPFDSLPYEQQDTARLKSVVKAERYEEAVAAAKAQEARVQQMRATEYQQKVDAARDRMPDFDDVFRGLAYVPFANETTEIIAESDKAAELTYWLGKNLNEAHRISGLPPHRQAAEVARIEAKLSAGPSPRRHSTAPPPPPTVSGASSPSAKDPANMSMDEYAKWYAGRSKG